MYWVISSCVCPSLCLCPLSRNFAFLPTFPCLDHMLSRFSLVWLFAILWTVAHQAPRSMGFSTQQYWSGLLFPIPGDLPDPGMEPTSLVSPALTGWFFTTRATWEAPSWLYEGTRDLLWPMGWYETDTNRGLSMHLWSYFFLILLTKGDKDQVGRNYRGKSWKLGRLKKLESALKFATNLITALFCC